ncbi:MAG: Thiosulfate sulfurtransferase GlpE [Candidatus Erwinia impunctatus]|nr:Thiosulfate sulfurtransferase GlpE [Culicoides impunctatus]
MGISAVLEFPPASVSEMQDYLTHKLAYYTDAADVAQDLARGVTEIVVLDVRSTEHYRTSHVCGALSFPHRNMDAATLKQFDSTKVYITYCDGIGCNGSTKGAWKLSQAGFKVKEMVGGLDFWQRDGLPVESGEQVGEWPVSETPSCAC